VHLSRWVAHLRRRIFAFASGCDCLDDEKNRSQAAQEVTGASCARPGDPGYKRKRFGRAKMNSNICGSPGKVDSLGYFRVFLCLLLLVCLGGNGAEFAQAKKSGATRIKAKAKVAPPAFFKGIQEFQAKRYGPAIEQFDLADKAGYCCDNTHYYLALCYHNLNQTQRAIDNYAWVYSYSKNPSLRYQAQVGYDQVARYASNRTYAGNGGILASAARSGMAAPSGGGGSGG
jgi:hypothetical protein